LFTLCPHCDTVHPLDAARLARANGRVSCGSCGKAFNALRHLHDDHPDAVSTRRRPDYSTQPPVLGADSAPQDGPPPAPDSPMAVRRSDRGWWALALVLALVAAVNAGWALRDRLPRDGALAGWLRDLGVSGFEAPDAWRDPGRIHLVARDLHTHPSRTGVLVLSATFVNLAEREQPYPTVAVTLLDPDNAPLLARAFEPAEYLAVEGERPGTLAPNQHVPLLLEFNDPGEQAVGFEIAFR